MSTGPGGDSSWHWSNPLPQGNDVLAQSWVSATTGWMAGRNGLLLKTTDSGATWAYQDPAITSDQRNTVDIRGVAFADANTGWIGGGNAIVKKTTDGGSSWATGTALPADFTGYAVNTVAAYNTSSVIAAGAGGRLAYSTNGGSTWGTPSTNPARTAGAAINSVVWQGATTAYAVTASGLILRTTDSGATWATQYTGTLALNSISFGSGTTVGYAVGTNGTGWTVLRTTNGTTWAAIGSQQNVALYGVSVLDANNAVLIGAQGACYKTANASAATPTWTSVMVGQMRDAELTGRSVRMISATRIAAAGDSGVSANSSDGGVSWTTARATVRGGMNATWFTDANNGWMCGANGVVRRTTDGGTTWTNQQVGTGTWRGIYFLNATTGWMVGDAGATARTTNGGTSWTPVTITGGIRLNAVRFYNATNGFAVGAGGYCYQTADGGTSWTQRTTGTANDLYGVYPVGTQNAYMVGAGGVVRRVYYNILWWANAGATTPGGTSNLYAMAAASTTVYWAVGAGGTVWRSTNSGANWTAVTSGTTQDLYSAYFMSTTAGLVGGANGTVRIWNGTAFSSATNTGLPANTTQIVRGLSYPVAGAQFFVPESGIYRKSTDGGANWLSQEAGIYGQLNAVSLVDATHGWAVGDTGRSYVTTNGTTWNAQLTRTAANLYGVSFGSATTGYGVGAAGTICRTTDAGATWTPQTVGTEQFNSVACSKANVNYAIAVGANGTIRYTTNGGGTWSPATSIPSGSTGDNMLAVSFVSASSTEIACIAVGHAAGDGSPTILRTTDHGQTWGAVANMNQPARSVSFAPAPNSAYGWAAGAAGAMYHTTDSGATWTTQGTGLTVALSGVSATTSQSAFAVGQSGVVAQTADGGATWLTQNSGFGSTGSTQDLLAVAFADANTGFAVGSGGAILKSSSQAPPSTTIALSPSTPNGLNGWYRVAAPSITLTPDQTARTYYRWDAGGYTQYSAALTAAEGAHTLYYYSLNAFNRAEPVRSIVVNTDLTAPTTAGNLVATPLDATSIQIQWNTSSTDAGSGVARYELWQRIGANAPTLAATTNQFATSAIAPDLTANTTYTFWVVAYDAAGNVSANSTTVNSSTTALGPLTTDALPEPLSADGANGWYVTNPWITLSVAPTEPSWTYYWWDGAAQATTYTAPFQLPTGGTRTLYYWSIDQAGQRIQEITNSDVFHVDLTSPNPGTCSGSDLTTSSLTVNWSGASDPESGVEYYYAWAQSSEMSTQSPRVYGTSHTFNNLKPSTQYGIYVQAVNAAGLTAVTTPVVYVTTASNPPVSTLETVTPNPADGANGWYRTVPNVSLATSPSYLASAIRYRWNSSAVGTYTAPVSAPNQGFNRLNYYSVDLDDAANQEVTQTLDFNVDTGAPSPPTGLAAPSSTSSSINLTWAAGSDGVSGVDHYLVYRTGQVDPVANVTGTSATVSGLAANQLYTFTVRAVDAAGNPSIDSVSTQGTTAAGSTMLTTLVTTPSTPDGVNGWYRNAPQLTFTTSPSDPAVTYYAWGTSSLTAYSGAFAPPNGVSTLSYWSIDQAHTFSQENTKTAPFHVDTTDPSAPANVNAVGASTTSLNVTWTGSTDAESAIGRYDVYIGSTVVTTVVGTQQSAVVTGLTADTPYTLHVTAVNGAGRTANSADAAGTTLSGVGVSTLTTVTPISPNGANGWYTIVPTITFGTAPASTPAQTYYCWDPPGVSSVYSTPISPAQGTHVLNYHSQAIADASDRDTTATATFNVDTGAPSPPTGPAAPSSTTSSINLTWAAGFDGVSGVDHYHVYFNGGALATATAGPALGATVTGLIPNQLYTFTVRAVDAAGSESIDSVTTQGTTAASSAMFTTLVTTPGTPDGANGWYRNAPQLTFTTSPSDPAVTYYAWGTSSLTAYSGAFAPPNGVSTLSYWSIDQAHTRSQENTKTAPFHVDTTDPSTPANVNAVGASTTSLNVTWTGSTDAESAIDHYGVYVGGTLATNVAGTSALVDGLAVNRTFEILVTAVNGAGRVATSTAVSGSTLANGEISTTLNRSASPNANGWYRIAPSLTFTTSPGTIPAWTYYCWDAPAASTTYTAAFTPPGEGVHVLDYHSVDRADDSNFDDTATATFRVDTGAPSPPTGLAAPSSTTNAISLTWAAGSDAVSGVDHYNVYDSFGVLATATVGPALGATVTGLIPNRLYTYTVRAVDAADNESIDSVSTQGTTAAALAMFTVLSPTPSTPDGQNGWYWTPPLLTATTSPGAVLADTYYRWGTTSSLTTYTAPFTAPLGANTVYFWSVDQERTRSQEDTQNQEYRVDPSDPSAPTSLNAVGASTTSLNISWTAAADAESGIHHYGVYVGGSLATNVAGTSALVGGLAVNRTFNVFVTAVNQAGRVTTSTTTSGSTLENPHVSTTATVSPAVPTGQRGWYNSVPAVSLTASPAALPTWTYYAWDPPAGFLTTYTAAITPPTQGSHQLDFHSVDQADDTNRDATGTITVMWDQVPPSPPTAISAGTVTTSTITVRWPVGADTSPGSGVHHYDLYMNNAPAGSYATTEAVLSGLKPNAIFGFRVETVDTAGNVSASSPTTYIATTALEPLVTTATVAPTTPNGLNSWYVTTPTVTFSWTPNVPAWTYYAWNGASLATVTGPIQPSVNGTNTLRYWSVDQALDHANEETKSLAFRMDTWPDVRPTPEAPAAMEVTATLVTDSQINIEWTPPPAAASGVDHYEVRTDTGPAVTVSRTYLASGLEPITKYPFKVYAINGAGTYYAQTPTLTVETSAPPLPYPPPSVLAVAPSGNYVNVNWGVSRIAIGELGYHVWRSQDAVNYSRVATVTGQWNLSYTDLGLASSRRYWYAVTAFDDRGESSPSDSSTAVWSYMAPTTGRAERVTTVTATEGSGTVLVSWSPASNPAVTGYYVTRAGQSLSTATTVTPVAVPATLTPAFLDNTAVNGETYYYRVYPVDTASTVGFGSLEVEAKPHSVLSTTTAPDVHIVPSAYADADTCQACHSSHYAASKLLQLRNAAPNEVPTCLRCHSRGSELASTDTSSQVTSPLNRSSTDMWLPGSTDSTMTCIGCHRTMTDEGTAPQGLLAAGGTTMMRDGVPHVGTATCYYCHGAGSTLRYGDMTDYDASSHASTDVPNPVSGSQVKCMACHESHASRNTHMTRYEGIMQCAQCHSTPAPDPNQADLWTRLTLNSQPNSSHALLPEDLLNGSRMMCQNCHSTHSSTSSNPVVDPHDPSADGVWTGDLATSTKDYCYRCHDGQTLPTSAEATPYAGAVLGRSGVTTTTNIMSAYTTNVHGAGLSANPTTTTALLRPDMGYVAGSELDCTACHDTHGSTNPYTLKTNVQSLNGETSVSGSMVYRIPAGALAPGSPEGYDYRYFCATCHKYDPKTHDPIAGVGVDTRVLGQTDCASCHKHRLASGVTSGL
jgi:predicted CXXCH cytochrome family protein